MKLLEQTQGHKVSESYKVITTNQVIERFTSKGYQVTSMQSARVRSADADGFQKHLIRVSHPDFATALQDARPEIVIVNSYNGSTALSMFLGAYRFVCANGLMVGTGFGGASIRHVGNVNDRIDAGIIDLIAQLPKMILNIETMQSSRPSEAAKNEFVKQATKLVIPDDAQTLTEQTFQNYVGRHADLAPNAYNVFNVVQERALRHGLFYVSEKGKLARTRSIKSVTRQVSVNRDLWDLANNILLDRAA